MPEPSIARSRYLFRSHHFLDSFPKYGRSNDAKHNTLHAASEGPAPVYPNPVAWSSHPTQHKQDNTADQGGRLSMASYEVGREGMGSIVISFHRADPFRNTPSHALCQ